MTSDNTTHRRDFLLMLGVVAAGVPIVGTTVGAAQEGGHDDWIKEVKGTHRCLFDFPQHNFGMPLLHILNYINTYSAAYSTTAGQVGAVGTFYSGGPKASIPLGFNDAVWEKYELGKYMSLSDASGRPYTRNVFNRPTTEDLHLVMQSIGLPLISALAPAVPALGI